MREQGIFRKSYPDSGGKEDLSAFEVRLESFESNAREKCRHALKGIDKGPLPGRLFYLLEKEIFPLLFTIGFDAWFTRTIFNASGEAWQSLRSVSDHVRVISPVLSMNIIEVREGVLRNSKNRSKARSGLNGLSRTCLSQDWKAHYHIRTKTDALDMVSMPEESRVVLVGAIVPALHKLKQRGGEWWVIEQEPRTLKADEIPHFVPAESSREAIDRAEVLIITGTALVNHTLDRILEGTRPGIEITVVGPTASMLPDPLFERGVKLVGGVRVKRPDELLSVLAAGGSGYHFFDHLAERIVIRNE